MHTISFYSHDHLQRFKEIRVPERFSDLSKVTQDVYNIAFLGHSLLLEMLGCHPGLRNPPKAPRACLGA